MAITFSFKKLGILLGGIVALCVTASTASAHGTGLALTKDVGQYTVDIHYPQPFEVAKPTWLNFFLFQGEETNLVPITDVDLSVTDSQQTAIFQTNITKKVNIGTGAIVTFPAAGTYTLFVTYHDGKTQLVQTSFPITVAGPKPVQQKSSELPANFQLLIAFALGCLVVVGFYQLDRAIRKP